MRTKNSRNKHPFIVREQLVSLIARLDKPVLDFAIDIRVNPCLVYQWIRGVRNPSKRYRDAIENKFGIIFENEAK